MERFEFITSDYFDKTVELYGLESLKINDIEEEVKKHLIFDIDVVWKIESWDLLDNGNLEVFIDIRQVIQLYLNIVLENQNGTLDYNEFDNLQEAREFYFYNIDDVFEIRGKNHNGYYSIYNENIFYKKIFQEIFIATHIVREYILKYFMR